MPVVKSISDNCMKFNVSLTCWKFWIIIQCRVEEVRFVSHIGVTDGTVLAEHVLVRPGEVLPVLHDQHDHRPSFVSAHLLKPIQQIHWEILQQLNCFIAVNKNKKP